MYDRSWTFLRKIKEVMYGTVWLVRDSYGDIGYFKFSSKTNWFYSGPLIATEMIAASLASKLGFIVPPLEIVTVTGPNGVKQEGIVSRRAIAKEVLTWSKAPSHVKENPDKYIRGANLLRQLVVFDTWIANLDRGLGMNLILARDQPKEKFHWYLIDHGNCLFGSARKWKRGNWRSEIWLNPAIYCNVSPALLVSSYRNLKPMITYIESLGEECIDSALESVPQKYLSKKVRRFTKKLLIYRQKRIRNIIGNWLAEKQ
jgi:hypothetical protein